MSVQQRKILDLAIAGENIFFTGSAGTGKSVVLRPIKKAFAEREARESARVKRVEKQERRDGKGNGKAQEAGVLSTHGNSTEAHDHADPTCVTHAIAEERLLHKVMALEEEDALVQQEKERQVPWQPGVKK